MTTQLALGDTPIETVTITPTKDMPLEVWRVCHHLAYFLELMPRLPDGRVVWNEAVESIYSERIADAEYEAFQRDWIGVSFELPAAFVESLGAD